MSVANFIPELWSARILRALEKNLVYGALCNTDYEGDISEFGDTVRINAIGPVTVAAYTPNATSITPEQLQDEQQVLTIDQSNFFAFYVDDVDARQAKGNLLAEGMQKAAYALADAADRYIAGLYTGAGRISAAPVAVNSANVYEQLLGLKEALDEANVPTEGRWCVIPPWFETKLLLAEVLVENTTNEAWTNGMVGRCAGFDLHKSNNVPATGGANYKIMAGTNAALSFAQQINKTEAYRPESSFADAVKGLHLFGAKVIVPDALAVLDASEAAES